MFVVCGAVAVLACDFRVDIVLESVRVLRDMLVLLHMMTKFTTLAGM